MASNNRPYMISVSEVIGRVQEHFDRNIAKWLSNTILEEIGIQGNDVLKTPSFSVSLHPPTEKYVLDNIAESQQWISEWRNWENFNEVIWEKRNWRSIGSQDIPVRFSAVGTEAIAKCADKLKILKKDLLRVSYFSGKWINDWSFLAGCRGSILDLAKCSQDIVSPSCSSEYADIAMKYITRAFKDAVDLSEEDWLLLIQVLDWLVKHPETEKYYVRQLPIRGVHSKWMEQHRRVINSFASAMLAMNVFSSSDGIAFKKDNRLLRVRILDKALAFSDMVDFSAPANQISFTVQPDLFIVCENLVNILALPQIEGAVAIHGGGYGVSELSKIPAISELNPDGEKPTLLYWGDIDTNGFAILNVLRHHIPWTRSVMMDIKTLEKYRDLCVSENVPNLGEFSNLKDEEGETLSALHGEEKFLRLEQERIEWSYAMEEIYRAINKIH